MMKIQIGKPHPMRRLLTFSLLAATFLIYWFSNPKPQNHYDYTFRVAENFIHGQIAFTEKQPSWLNEFVPFENFYYSVFPLGSVLTMMPFAVLKFAGIVSKMPAAFIAALIAAAICFFLLRIAERYEFDRKKRILLVAGILYGTWTWTNLTLGGAWQLALGFAMLGEIGAIYFSVYKPKPLLAGIFFALAFGNRTEILLTAPIFIFLLLRNNFQRRETENSGENPADNSTISRAGKKSGSLMFGDLFFHLRREWKTAALFCLAPFLLGAATLLYNYARFHSPFDFGYARIPGVLDEPWYDHGIFSLYYIPRQAYEMLLKPWKRLANYPYLLPDGFSSSILWSSPFLLLALAFGARDKILKRAAWTAIIVLTFLLWIHGNSGGWQFGYRYAMILLPWLFIVLLENSPRKITLLESAAYAVSFLINAYAIYLFHWSGQMKP